MKTIELGSGLRTFVSNEENLLLEKIRSAGGTIGKANLSEREQVFAHELLKKGVLTRVKTQGKLFYRLDDTGQVWRI